MNVLHQLSLGLKAFRKAIPFIFKHKMGWLFLIPIALNIVLFSAGFASIGSLIELILAEDWIQKENWNFWGGEYLNESLYWIIQIGMRILFFILFAYFGGFIVLILLSPVLAYVSERTEKTIKQTDYPFQFSQFLKDIWRGILVAVRNFGIEMLWVGITFLIAFIPIIGWFSPLLMFFVSSYFYGFSFIDYYNERRKYNVAQSARYVRKQKGIAISIGALYASTLIIPIIGSTLAGFMAIIATVGATMATLEMSDKENEAVTPKLDS
ncbi:MAG: hypothetical protein CL843_05415 [Crocinitomicaceae bacterium]|nr:hypothetical protein [Crocinitomicaceae bacterium]|tara:strand:- start:2698 stop:3498 length:801 start_codon:yes stop_codon:yes gene_type:complete